MPAWWIYYLSLLFYLLILNFSMTIYKHGLPRDYTKAIKRHKAVLMPFDCPSTAMGGEDLENQRIAVRFVASATVASFFMHWVVSVLLKLLPEEVIFVLTSNAVTPE